MAEPGLEGKGAHGPGLPTPTPGLLCPRNSAFPYNRIHSTFSSFVTLSVCAEA